MRRNLVIVFTKFFTNITTGNLVKKLGSFAGALGKTITKFLRNTTYQGCVSFPPPIDLWISMIFSPIWVGGKSNTPFCGGCKDNMGRTPLLLACRGGHFQIVQQPLEYGADVDCVDHCGRAALQHLGMAWLAADSQSAAVPGCCPRGLDYHSACSTVRLHATDIRV